ncbi:hypothetical protein ABL78_3476 [Leptomonas seymouri]|uniref:Transmembrane protein n=1 Tax=Leptomonas seymouri TaxID=5684 RepID=A0A0N1HZH6_LEPSE|nr:hypothetical protein ABL78_3476 [Leptomonas seymouri]|eukprot:KPI87445.1 hypothetical protein ABL78_3476 [Leptomonas seymouri]
MLTPSMLLRSRIPDIGHETSARFKWATYTFWYVLDPVLRRHHWYYLRKVQLDRFLERNNIAVNTAIGVILGVTLYFTIVRGLLLPPAVGAKEHSMKENAREVLDLMKCDTSKELPAYQLMRVKREIIGKLHAVSDEAEVHRQRDEVERISTLIKSLQ